MPPPRAGRSFATLLAAAALVAIAGWIWTGRGRETPRVESPPETEGSPSPAGAPPALEGAADAPRPATSPPPSRPADPALAASRRGWDLIEAGRYEEASRSFDEAVRLNPALAEARQGKGRALAFQALVEAEGPRPSDALFTLDAAREAGAEPSLMAKVRGLALARIGETDRAIDALEEAARGRPDDLEVLIPLASLDYRRGRLAEAREVLRRLVQLDPGDADLRDFLARVEREAPIEQGFHENESSHFLARYEGGTQAVAGHWVAQILEEAYRKVGADFGAYPPGQVSVILYSGKDFRAVTGSPDWMGAVYDGQIRVPIGGLEGRTESLERLLYHEYTHALVHSIAGDRCPTWLQEGLAQYEEGGGAVRDRPVLKVLGRLPSAPPLAKLEGSFAGLDAPQAQAAYAAALSFTAYLVDGYGMGRMRDFLKDLGGGMPAEAALRDVYRMGYDDLVPRWWSASR